jgi:hypothetical protein
LIVCKFTLVVRWIGEIYLQRDIFWLILKILNFLKEFRGNRYKIIFTFIARMMVKVYWFSHLKWSLLGLTKFNSSHLYLFQFISLMLLNDHIWKDFIHSFHIKRLIIHLITIRKAPTAHEHNFIFFVIGSLFSHWLSKYCFTPTWFLAFHNSLLRNFLIRSLHTSKVHSTKLKYIKFI